MNTSTNDTAACVYLGEADCHRLHRHHRCAMFLWWCESAWTRRWNPAVCRICQQISPSSTHTHFDTSSSMFCNPPPTRPYPKRPQSPVSCLSPYSISLFSYVTLPERTTSGVGRFRRQTCAAAAKSNQRWLISGSLIIKQAFIDHYTETIYLLFCPQTVWQLIDSDRRWLPHHCLSFIRL